MTFLSKIFCCTVLFFNLSAISVRVLLDEQKVPVWTLTAPQGFAFKDAQNEKRYSLGAQYEKITITVSGSKLCVNGVKMPTTSLVIHPLKTGTTLDQNTYDGFFLVTQYNGVYCLINVLDSEDYVYSVLKTESWPGWPLEMNKALAVAVRSYVFYQLKDARKRRQPYHIRNTNHHQTYTGLYECKVRRDAVDQTQNLILSHKGQPILAMFDSCCGGILPRHVDSDIDFKKAPYLDRTYPCNFCKSWKYYSWTAQYSLDEFKEIMEDIVAGPIHDIKDIYTIKNKSNGMTKTLIAKTAKREHTFSARQMFRFFKNKVKSLSFNAERKAKNVIITGKGYGHHMGMCQWGAREMVDQGWAFDEILDFFYPNTTFMRVETSKKSGE